MENKGYFISFFLIQTHLGTEFPPPLLSVVPYLLVWERGGRTLSEREIYTLLSSQKKKEREFFLCLLFLNCLFLQLKIILMPKWHVLGWHILILFISKILINKYPKHYEAQLTRTFSSLNPQKSKLISEILKSEKLSNLPRITWVVNKAELGPKASFPGSQSTVFSIKFSYP